MNYLGFDIGIAMLSTPDSDDFLGIQIDAYGEGKSGVVPYAMHSPYGILSRCLDPDVDSNGLPTAGCTTLHATMGGQGHAWLLSDPRIIPKLPLLAKGESMMYASPGQFIRLRGETGDIDTAGDLTMLTSSDGTLIGDVYFQVARNAFRFIAPWGSLVFDSSGFQIKTKSGASFTLGGIGGIPLVGNYCLVEAGAINLNGAAVSMGPPGTPMPVTLSTPLVSILTTLIGVVGAMNAVGGAGVAVGAPALALLAQIPALIGSSSSS